MNNGKYQERGSAEPPANAGSRHDPVYYYKDSGIQEQHGYVPIWLRVVAVSLVTWGIYYMIANWSPPT